MPPYHLQKLFSFVSGKEKPRQSEAKIQERKEKTKEPPLRAKRKKRMRENQKEITIYDERIKKRDGLSLHSLLCDILFTLGSGVLFGRIRYIPCDTTQEPRTHTSSCSFIRDHPANIFHCFHKLSRKLMLGACYRIYFFLWDVSLTFSLSAKCNSLLDLCQARMTGPYVRGLDSLFWTLFLFGFA